MNKKKRNRQDNGTTNKIVEQDKWDVDVSKRQVGERERERVQKVI